MQITKHFVLGRPLPAVWAFFKDIPVVATCLPGTEYLGPVGEKHRGKVSTKVGPFRANFEGEADVNYDDAMHSIRVEGKGVDKKGASRSKMSMSCALHPENEATRVELVADIQLSGPIAQFGRTSLVKEIADTLIAEFARNVEAKMAPEGSTTNQPMPGSAPQANTISFTRLILKAIKAWFRRPAPAGRQQ